MPLYAGRTPALVALVVLAAQAVPCESNPQAAFQPPLASRWRHVAMGWHMQTEKNARVERRAVAGLLTGSVLLLAPAEAFSEKKRPSGGLAGENPNAAQDLFTAKFQQGLNKRTNRLFGCQTQNNCVSTAAGKNPTQFVAPWDFTTKFQDAEEAWEALKQVVELDSSLKVIAVDDDLMYLHATGTSKVPKDGIDDVEFLMVPDEKIVTTRSGMPKEPNIAHKRDLYYSPNETCSRFCCAQQSQVDDEITHKRALDHQ